MSYTQIILSCALATLSSAIAIAFLYRHAEALGLIDRPSDRKKHVGNIPLIGGLAALAGILVGACFTGQSHTFFFSLLSTATALALLGALDDRFDLSVRSRLLVQTTAVLLMVGLTGIHIHTLGHLFGHELELGVLGIPLTLIAVIGLLNAFNMMDGIDGLAGMLALVSIGAISLYQGLSHWQGVIVLLLLAAALAPYLAMNLGLVGRKIFLGDAGSMVVGYLLAWMLIKLSQDGQPRLSTIDVLWCVALPVLDTLAVMVRRIREGKSPFKPDRGHIHHLLLNAGLSHRATLIVLVGMAVTLAATGSLTRTLTPGSNLLAFSALTLIYVITHGQVWRRQQSALNAPLAPAPIPRLRGRIKPRVRVRSTSALHAYQPHSEGPPRTADRSSEP